MSYLGNAEIMKRVAAAKLALPAFNIPYPPIMEPVVRALVDTNSFGLVAVARCEWEKFGSKSMKVIRERYEGCREPNHVRLHLDHVPVIDEDDKLVDYKSIIKKAIDLGFESVMVDGSRLSLDENIHATAEIVKIAHSAGIPVEGELGSVFGHESGPTPPYEELFSTGKGFTDVSEAQRFVKETDVDWLSVAIGNVHGAISGAARSGKKLAARLHIGRLSELYQGTGRPLVLHGGSGIPQDLVLEAVKNGIAKINIGTVVRQAYEQNLEISAAAADKAVYDLAVELIKEMEIENSASIINK